MNIYSKSIMPFLQIMRLDKPIGTFLLWYPTAWALWMANQGMPRFRLLLLFLTGTLVMRSAGCVINDYFDRDFDRQVQRTNNRPLAKGSLRPQQALILLLLLFVLALIILLCLPISCVPYAIGAVFLTCLYPLCKRFINTPQLILSLAFSMAIPMAYAASTRNPGMEGLALIFINLIWVLAYDTIYAMADKQDDIKAGIKSTAVYLGNWDKAFVKSLQTLMHLLWLFWGYFNEMHAGFYLFWILSFCNLLWQQKLIKQSLWIEAFKANSMYGLCMWLAIIVGLL